MSFETREFAYVTDGPLCVLAGDYWYEYLSEGEVGRRLVLDDGTRGWRLSGRLRHRLGLE